MKYGIVTQKLITVKGRDFLADVKIFLTVNSETAYKTKKNVGVYAKKSTVEIADSLGNILSSIVYSNKISASSFEDFSKLLLERIYELIDANEIEVSISSDISLKKKTPSTKKDIEETYRIISKAILKNGKIRKMIGAEVVGITSCPCAQEGLAEYSREVLKERFNESEIAYILSKIPIASHNQRNVTKVLIEVQENFSINVVDLIDIIESSMSSSIYEVLKRSDETRVVLEAHLRPRFVEDVVRNILIKLVEKYKDLPDDSLIIVKSESFESIHKHNAIAERTATIGEIKEELKINNNF